MQTETVTRGYSDYRLRSDDRSSEESITTGSPENEESAVEQGFFFLGVGSPSQTHMDVSEEKSWAGIAKRAREKWFKENP